MDRKPATTSAAAPATATADLSTDLVALLRDVLRNVNREVRTTIELSDEADAAVSTFRAIAFDLATRPTSSFSTSSAIARSSA